MKRLAGLTKNIAAFNVYVAPLGKQALAVIGEPFERHHLGRARPNVPLIPTPSSRASGYFRARRGAVKDPLPHPK